MSPNTTVRPRFLSVPILGLAAVLTMFVEAEIAEASSTNVPRERVAAHPLSPYPYEDPENLGFSHEVIADLGREVAEWVSQGEIVGAEVLVLKSGKIAWHETFGFSDIEDSEPMRPAGVFRIRSMTKPMLGTAVLRLVDRGLLQLDDPVSRYLPSLGSDAWKAVTIESLLEHTSGLEYSPFPRARQSYSSLRESVDDLADAPPSREPGEFFYSDAGSAILGAVLEGATGESLESVLAAEVFAPLDLQDTHTRYEPTVVWRDRMNSTHRWDEDTQSHRRYWAPDEPQEMSYFRASGGIYSTVFDYARFLGAWLHAVRGNSAEFLDPSLAVRAVSQATEAPYGMHWESVEAGASPIPSLFGHGGSDGTMALCLPDQDLIVLFFTQSRGCDCRDQFAMRAGLTGEFGVLANIGAFGTWRDNAPDIEAATLSTEERSRYVGFYDVRGRTVEIRETHGRLQLIRGVEPPQAEPHDDPATQSVGSVVCRPALAVALPVVDLIPLGEHRFALGILDDTGVREVFWPGRDLIFHVLNDRVVGYEMTLDPQVVERARKYRWDLARPAPKREPLPETLAGSIGGTYESGYFGTIDVVPTSDGVILKFGSGADTLAYQGAGFFRSDSGHIVTFSQAEDTHLLRVLEDSGTAYEFARPVDPAGKDHQSRTAQDP